jgi:hypothetical protein
MRVAVPVIEAPARRYRAPGEDRCLAFMLLICNSRRSLAFGRFFRIGAFELQFDPFLATIRR